MKNTVTSPIRLTLRGLVLALAVTALSSQVARAVPYASCITNNAGTISFILNEAADDVKVIYDGLTVTNDLGGQTKGLHSFSLGTHTDYAIYVYRNTPFGWTKTSADTNALLLFNIGRGITVNTSPKDAHSFGRIYIVSSAVNGGVASNPTVGISRTLVGRGLYVLNADQSDAFGKGATAITNGMTFSGGASEPWKPGFGRDDNMLYVNSFANGSAGTWVMDPDLKTCTNMIYGIGITGGYHYDPANTPIVHGTLADGNLTLWNVEGSRPSFYNKVARWDIYSGPLGSPITPTILGWCDHDPSNLGSAGLNTDIEVLDDGKIITSLNRAAGTDTASIQVFDTDGATLLWNSLTAGGSPDPLRLTRAIALSPDHTHLAMVRDGGSMMIVTLTNGIPDLGTLNVFTNGDTTLATATTGASARDIAYDAAGNLYLIGGTNTSYALYGAKVYSPGGNTLTITANDATGLNGTFSATNFISVVTLTATQPNTSEDTSTPPGVFTISRTGDTAYPLKVGYSITGTASNGVDYTTIPTSVTIPASASSVDITITAIPDSIAEPTETVMLTLSNSVNYITGTMLPATVYISDTNTPVLSVSAISPSMYERVTNDYATVTIARNLGNTNVYIMLNDPGVFTYGGTAKMNVDYVVNSNAFPIVINYGDRADTVNLISPIDNSILDGNRTVVIGLAAGADYVAATNTATTTIIDDEYPGETVLWSDNFNTDSSANYTIQFGSGNSVQDYSVNFAFDYLANYNVPPAPHSTSGDTLGLLLNVNKYDSTALGAAGLNLYPTGKSFSGNYALRFDMYLFNGTLGTTEYALFGINHDGAHTNWFRSSGNGYTNSSYDGIWASVESDASGTDDYVLFSGPTNNNSAIWGPTYRAAAGAGTFKQVFKSPPFTFGGVGGGSPANDIYVASPEAPTWADVELSQVGNVVTMKINHTVILCYTNTVAAMSGNIMFGYDDAYDSIGNSYGVIIDNARVVQLFLPTIVSQPTSAVTPVGGSTNFTVVASGSTTGFTNYQWRFNGVAIPGATNATLPLNNVQLSNYGAYTVIVSDGVYSVTSVVANLVVMPSGIALGNGTGLTAGYWTLHTNTAPYTGNPTLTRLDSAVNFDWGVGSPDPLISTDYFTVRWVGQVQALSTNTDLYTFTTISDDGSRLWVNGQLVVDTWIPQSAIPHSGTIALTGTNKYDIVMEYFEQTGNASAQLYWSNATTVGYSVIPQSQLYAGASVLPAVALTAPANGASFNGPAAIPLAATVTPNNNAIKYVSFYNGPTLVGSVTNAPYTTTWNNVTTGNYAITAAVVYNTNWMMFSTVTNSVTVTALGPVTSMGVSPGAGSDYNLNYSGGAGSQFVLVCSTNVAAPLNSWTRVATNTAASGSFTISPSAAPKGFYRIISE